MNTLYHLIYPARDRREKTASKIHYESADGHRSLCDQVMVFHLVDGEKMRVWYRTKRPVTCKSCVKILEQRVRAELKDLTGDQLEDLLAHIETFRSRFGQAREH